MSSVEIEDVLSSIRRLVSDDLRPAKTQAGVAAALSAETASKLILTPSLRVVPGDGGQAAGDAAAAPLVAGGDAGGIATAPVALVPDMVDDTPLTHWTSADWSEAETAGFVAIDEYDDEPAAEPAPLPSGLQGQFADGGEDVPPRPMVDVGQDLDPAADAASPQDADTWVELAAPEPIEPEWEDILPETPEMPEDDTTAAAAAHASVAPDVDATRAWADQAEAEVLRQLSDEAADRFVGAGDLGPDDGPLYDEELLRDLVRDIIREELQGTLGERITRNVRKLVRAEIARAMALREFE